MWKQPKIYAVKHKNLKTRMASRSGGAFTALSDEVLEHDGVVYGCVLNEDFKAVHIRAEKTEERNRMRGSKYIQSNLGETFTKVREDLESGRRVLFSGTSCQVAGLYGYIGKEYENLLCVDIVCHGVPSSKVWEEYLHWQEGKVKGQCTAVDFRNKKDYGWAAHVETLTMSTISGEVKTIHSEVFKTLFFGHNILRPSCYQCPYKSTMHPGNVTIADYWGIDKTLPEFNDNKGVSLVFINDGAGADIFEKVKEFIEYQECNIENNLQLPLVKPSARPDERDTFWVDFRSKPFVTVAKKYGGFGAANDMKHLLERIKRKIKRIL